MERLDDFSSDDLISALVDDLRVESTLFCRSLFTAPWGFAVAARDLAVFHIVLAGRCHLAVDGIEDGVALTAGDLVILPQGREHSVRDSPTSPVTALEDLLDAGGFEGFELRHGGGGPATELLCGGFSVGRETGPLLSGLPPLVCVRGQDGRPVGWLEDLLRLLRRELAQAEPGARNVVARLADLLVAQALRAFLASRDGSALPPLRVLQDRHVAGAVAAIHEQPEHGRWPSWQCERPCRARRLRLGSGTWSANRRCTTCGVAGSPARLRICAQTTGASSRSRG